MYLPIVLPWNVSHRNVNICDRENSNRLQCLHLKYVSRSKYKCQKRRDDASTHEKSKCRNVDLSFSSQFETEMVDILRQTISNVTRTELLKFRFVVHTTRACFLLFQTVSGLPCTVYFWFNFSAFSVDSVRQRCGMCLSFMFVNFYNNVALSNADTLLLKNHMFI